MYTILIISRRYPSVATLRYTRNNSNALLLIVDTSTHDVPYVDAKVQINHHIEKKNFSFGRKKIIGVRLIILSCHVSA